MPHWTLAESWLSSIPVQSDSQLIMKHLETLSDTQFGGRYQLNLKAIDLFKYDWNILTSKAV